MGDVIELDEKFIYWLKKPETLKKIETGKWWLNRDGIPLERISNGGEWLRNYPDDFLLETLKCSEFYLKEGQLFIRLAAFDPQYGGHLYWDTITTSARPSYIEYVSCRIAVEDLGDFLKAEPW